MASVKCNLEYKHFKEWISWFVLNFQNCIFRVFSFLIKILCSFRYSKVMLLKFMRSKTENLCILKLVLTSFICCLFAIFGMSDFKIWNSDSIWPSWPASDEAKVTSIFDIFAGELDSKLSKFCDALRFLGVWQLELSFESPQVIFTLRTSQVNWFFERLCWARNVRRCASLR